MNYRTQFNRGMAQPGRVDVYSAEGRIRTGEPLREQILSLSPLTRLGNFGLNLRISEPLIKIRAQWMVVTSPLGPAMYTVCSHCDTHPPLTSFRMA